MISPLFLAYILTGNFFINDDVNRWLDYKTNYHLDFPEIEEERTRFNIFIENVRSIEEHNVLYELGEVSWTQTINEFAHLSPEEFIEKVSRCLKLDYVDYEEQTVHIPINDSIPMSIDWTVRKKVTPVKNQLKCGSCWAFSTIGAVESQYAIKYNVLRQFSEQNLLDCAGGRYHCYGCSGGDPYGALRYIQDWGVFNESSYPYTGRKNICRGIGSFHTHGQQLIKNNEGYMRTLVGSYGPISATLNAKLLQFYHTGIIDSFSCPRKINHAILITGYGNKGSTVYWKIKNSWGSQWGEQGYFRMVFGRNMCGISSYVSYPIIL